MARLDLDVDGTGQHRLRGESEACRSATDNPYGLGLVSRQTPLRTEAEGQQDYHWDTQRGWKVVSKSTAPTGSAPRSATSWSPAAASRR